MYPAMDVHRTLYPALKFPQLRRRVIIVRNGFCSLVLDQPDQCRGLVSSEYAARANPVCIVKLEKSDLRKRFYQIPELVRRDCRCLNTLRGHVLLALIGDRSIRIDTQ